MCADVMLNIGATPIFSKKGEVKYTVEQWQNDVLKAQNRKSSEIAFPAEVGKSSEKSLKELFISRKNKFLPCWAAPESLFFLDFWKKFDTSITFLIAHMSPSMALKALAKEEELSAENVNALLTQWKNATEYALRFHEKNKERCIIVDIHEEQNSSSKHQKSTIKKTLITTSVKKKTSGDQPLNEHSWQEDPDQHHIKNLHEYMQKNAMIRTSSNDFSTLQEALFKAVTSKKITDLGSPAADLKMGHRLADSQNNADLKTALDEIQLENELIIEKLHHVQESLEQSLIKNKKLSKASEQQARRVERLLDKYPDHWEIESLIISAAHISTDKQTTQWQLVNAYIANEVVSDILFKLTVCKNGAIGFEIQKTERNWLTWSPSNSDSDILHISTSKGGAYDGTNKVISSLGPKDWARLNSLVETLIRYLTDSSQHSFPEQADKKMTLDGLDNFKQILRQWPMVPRYDGIKLTDTFQEGSYKSLGIAITNFTIGQHRWGTIEYRLASVDQLNETFGSHPRIEFPASNKTSLQNWFAETEDERGPRLELRFAKPDEMDLQVWSTIAAEDKLLIAGLIGSLNHQLFDLKSKSETINLKWSDWLELAQTIKNISIHKTTSMQK
ncbi:hypothetical protein CUB86_24865 [Pseudomonas syringae pv. actinidiae]|uniref:Uncharacterized protein n=3 Tax=Pseudomonas syringae group TaxID=136849 RepID=A0AAU8XDA9_PSESF|nr:hypothetical protein CT122_05555 [Pseudomonas syringae pv. actinidiae]PIN58957.1 hypothetical protein CUB86_24865 [Pseudomonas syringae pv. actinidiae]